jgi:phytoene synthase
MKEHFDQYCYDASKRVTKKYSTSFYIGVKSLDKNIRSDIHNIYGFVRLADEIVDSFHDFDKAQLLEKLKTTTFEAIEQRISINPILNSFQKTVNTYNIDHELIHQFLHSMEMDLEDVQYNSDLYEEYIFGSAEVVGLMCLKIFVGGDEDKYQELKPFAMKLGSAFQKINFLRDLNEDTAVLGRTYFPNVNINNFSANDKRSIEENIQAEFDEALIGIKMLPKSSRFGVYVSYSYYRMLLKRIKRNSAKDLMNARIRVPDRIKVLIFAKSLLKNSTNRL